MSIFIPVPVLLTVLVLSACPSHGAALVQTSSFLKESICWLNKLLESKVSCGMNVTDIFAGDEKDDMKLLCKAATVAFGSRSCHMHLEAIYLNLYKLIQRKSAVHRPPCSVEAGSTTSLSNFLQGLRRVLQRLAKE